MHIAAFQQWVKVADDETQWNCLATLQILSHLTEEVGELVRASLLLPVIHITMSYSFMEGKGTLGQSY